MDKIKNHSWSPDTCVGEAGRFKRSQMVCAKTLYNHIDLGLLDVKNTDLPMKLRRNTNSTRVKKPKKKLGSSISDRPVEINTRDEFGHWEIDTVIIKIVAIISNNTLGIFYIHCLYLAIISLYLYPIMQSRGVIVNLIKALLVLFLSLLTTLFMKKLPILKNLLKS